MRCLITGAEGFLGANLCRALQAGGHEVVGTSLNRKGHTSLDALGVSCRIEYGDVTDRTFVERVVLGTEAEWVFHLAGVSIVRLAQADPARALHTNVMGTVNVLEACRRSAHVQAVLVASSDKAYGDYSGLAYFEGMSLRPVAPYEVSKACADLIGQSYAATYGLPVKILRCANLYGPGDLNWSRLIPNSCRLAVSGRPPIVHEGSAHMQREWLYVGDAAEAYMHLAAHGLPGVYNVGSGECETSLHVAETISSILSAPHPACQRKAAPFAEIPAQRLICDKIYSLGWHHVHSLATGLWATATWYGNYLGAREPALCVS